MWRGLAASPCESCATSSALLGEPEAPIFYACLSRIASVSPPAFVLENVEGISRCMSEVLDLLRAVGVGYHVTTCLLNPAQLGEPVHRPRYYFIGTRVNFAVIPEPRAQLIYDNVWRKLQQDCPSVSLQHRLLPADHPSVAAHQLYRKQRWELARAHGYPDKPGKGKWKVGHVTWEKSQRLTAAPASASSDQMLLHLPRERDVWAKLVAQKGTTGARLVADVSQSLGRNGARTDGSLPTITPGAHVLVLEAQRSLVPLEKLLTNALPLHVLKLPSCVSEQDIEKMGGNMMHLQTVAVAMMLALSFVDWSMSAAHAAPAAQQLGPHMPTPGPPSGRGRQRPSRQNQVEALPCKRYGLPYQGSNCNKARRGAKRCLKQCTKDTS